MTAKYYNDKGEVGVIVCPGYGAGWSTWGEGSPFDPDIIKAVLDGVKGIELAKIAEQKDPECYPGGLTGNVKIEFLPQGTRFKIIEYDGSERIEYQDKQDWLTA